MEKMTTCLLFNNEAEEAAKFYVSIFKGGKIGRISHYGKEGHDIHKRPEGSVLTVEFEINGQRFMALNGPGVKPNEAVSFVINCESQDEIDYYWSKLTEGGGREGQCGWLTDKYGLSWQVIPASITEMLTDPDQRKSDRVMKAFMQMKKFDLNKINQAYMQ